MSNVVEKMLQLTTFANYSENIKDLKTPEIIFIFYDLEILMIIMKMSLIILGKIKILKSIKLLRILYLEIKNLNYLQ